MGELILLDSFRPRRESDTHEKMILSADVRMLRQISSWAECLAEIAEHFEEPLHPDDRKKALNMRAIQDDQPLEL